MKDKKVLNRLIENNNGILKTSEAKEAGISPESFYRYIYSEKLEKIAEGIYLDKNTWPDEMYLLQLQFPKAIFSYDSALYLHNMSEMEPIPLTVTVPAKYNTPMLKKKAKVYYVKNDWYFVGRCNILSTSGNVLTVYNKERTVCDIIRKQREMDVSIFNYALQQYVKSKDKDYVKLMEYARLFHIEKRLRMVMGVLL